MLANRAAKNLPLAARERAGVRPPLVVEDVEAVGQPPHRLLDAALAGHPAHAEGLVDVIEPNTLSTWGTYPIPYRTSSGGFCWGAVEPRERGFRIRPLTNRLIPIDAAAGAAVFR